MDGLNTLDIIFLIAILLGGIMGFSRGFVLSLLSFAGKILAAFLAVRYLEPFIAYFRIKDLFLRGAIDLVKEYIPLGEEVRNLPLIPGLDSSLQLPLEENMLVKVLGSGLQKELERLSTIAENLELSTIGDFLALIVANFLVNMVSFFVLFLLFLIGFSIIRTILVKIIGMSDFVTGADKLLGFIFGAAVDIFIVALIAGFSYDILHLLSLKEGGWAEGYRILLQESFLRPYLQQIYHLLITEGIKLL